MDVLVVNYDPFAMESRLYVMRDGKRGHMDVCSNIANLP